MKAWKPPVRSCSSRSLRQVVDAVGVPLDVAEEHGGVGLQPLAVDRLDHLQPARAADLLRADLLAHRRREDLGAAAGHGAEPGGLELGDDLFDALPGESGEVIDLHRGEGLDVQLRLVGADRSQHLQVEVEGEIGMEAADHVDLGRPGRRRLGALLQDVVERQGVAPLVLHPLGKGAEGTAVDAEVGVVDVAVDVEVDLVAVLQPIGVGRQLADGEQVVGLEQRQRLGIGDAHPGGDLVVELVEEI